MFVYLVVLAPRMFLRVTTSGRLGSAVVLGRNVFLVLQGQSINA